MQLIRICPSCGSERPISEMFCGAVNDAGSICRWRLADVVPTAKGKPIEYVTTEQGSTVSGVSEPSSQARLCLNGHQVPEGEFLCLECGADVIETVANEATVTPLSAGPVNTLIGQSIEGWTISEAIESSRESRDCFRVENTAGEPAYLVLYQQQCEPDTSIHDVLRKTDHDHVPDILLTGRWQQRSFVIMEWISGGSLADNAYLPESDLAAFKRITSELGRALHDLSGMGIRHRNICPRAILIRTEEPLDLVITDFSSARLSDFDLDTVAPLELTRYTAPEAIIGGVSIASDWWSLGMILLQQATAGSCFEGIHEQAFSIHIVTRGIELPDSISAPLRPLLQGLLARDPLQRWQWNQVSKWLNDEIVEVPLEHRLSAAAKKYQQITINGVGYTDAEQLALGVATLEHWQAGLECFESGALLTWLQANYRYTGLPSAIQQLMTDAGMPSHWRFALALMELNPALPLVHQGVLVTPAWLLDHPAEGFALITGDLPVRLEAMEREPWLVYLCYRYRRVLERAAALEIALEPSRLRLTALATSKANLDAERDRLGELYPLSNHDALASIMERPHLSDEDLVLLLCAKVEQFTPLAEVIEGAIKLAGRHLQTPLPQEIIGELITMPRSQLYRKLDHKIADFARCHYPTLDHWADEFRIQRRISLTRATVLLSLADEAWIVPPKQDYTANILHFFEKRVINSIMRGPLVRLVMSRTGARIDMTELDSPLKPALMLTEHLLARNDIPLAVDPHTFQVDSVRERRLWRLVQTASNNRRDSGIDTLYLGFPFLIMANQNARPRIAPIFLWPVKVDFAIGARALLKLSFDSERSEVRLNPALESLVGQTAMNDWHDLHTNVLQRTRLSVADVIEAVGALVPVIESGLQQHPSADYKVKDDAIGCYGSAVIFNAQFSGQAIAEDIRQLQHKSVADTALASLLRVKEAPLIPTIDDMPAEQDRYNVVAADPSQDRAILTGRVFPGVVIEGPPGTGKSQTIVNIIADCIGRKEKVLVVCQKQAALRVVEKRLEAVSLSHRLLTITDIAKDRQSVIRAIRDQLDSVAGMAGLADWQISRTRQQLSTHIDQLEKELNDRHEAIHQQDELSERSYRQILTELIELDSQEVSQLLRQPTVRHLLAGISARQLDQLEEQCASLAFDWLRSDYENSALSCFTVFNVDTETTQSIKQAFTAHQQVERSRSIIDHDGSPLSTTGIHHLADLETWGQQHLSMLESLSNEQITMYGGWFDLFYDEVNRQSEGEDILVSLKDCSEVLQSFDERYHDERFFAGLQALTDSSLKSYLNMCRKLIAPVEGLHRYSLLRYWYQNRITKLLTQCGEVRSVDNMVSLGDALQLELRLKPLRRKLSVISNKLHFSLIDSDQQTLKYLRRTLAHLIEHAGFMVNICAAIKLCPLRNEAKKMLHAGDQKRLNRFVHDYRYMIHMTQAHQASLHSLSGLKPWLEPQWFEQQQQKITSRATTLDEINAIVAQLDTLVAYQRFRLRSNNADALALRIFAQLRPFASSLVELSASQLSQQIRQCIRRETLLGWKSRIEESTPLLLVDNQELEQKLAQLSELDGQKADLNRTLLMGNIDTKELAHSRQWSDITRLRGQKYKKLREFIDLGRDLGLMELRPVWMMSPEAVSQALPRIAKLFDVVVFDEASQMMVDFAIPALYRARRVIVSGDEKQMPPSSFFAGNVEIDEDENVEELDDDASEAEIVQYNEAWDRREIKDCPDLLTLGKAVLPARILEIHYRSAYRALIDFSNYAYYSGKLHVPALHPDDVIVKVKPIEVHHLNGVYVDQTNLVEAQKIVEIIAEIWTQPEEQCPSLGIVTFNKKQAELIEDVLQNYAEQNPLFYEAYRRELDRQQQGEDMGFFVKNVENVQGDERDIMFFSTTFGLNEHGSFRRNFGALGHKGGERRLNVAVTRAREKVVIVTSMPLRDISDMLATGRTPTKPRDYLQAYLEYASKISAGEIRQAKQRIAKVVTSVAPKLESGMSDTFVTAVADYLHTLGYQPEPGSGEDAFSVDLAIIHPQTGQFGLGIECDAPVNPLLHNTRARDIWRRQVLQKSFPFMHRINCYDWYHHNEREKSKLKDKLMQAIG